MLLDLSKWGCLMSVPEGQKRLDKDCGWRPEAEKRALGRGTLCEHPRCGARARTEGHMHNSFISKALESSERI